MVFLEWSIKPIAFLPCSLLSPSSLQKLPSLARKRDSRRHSIMSLGENVIVTETSYQMLEAVSFTVYRSGEGLTSVKIIVLKNERFGLVVFYINEN